MSLSSPIFKKIMSDYAPKMEGSSSIAKNTVDSALATNTSNLFSDTKESSLADPRYQEADITSQPDLQANPTSRGDIMDTLWDVETKGGTIADRPGSQYKGIGQLGDDVRKPLLAKYGYTEDQYDNSTDIQKKLSTEHINNIRDRIGSNATNLDLWGSHNMGVSGWKQIKSGKVSPKVLSNLRNQKGMNSRSTAQDYINYYSKIFN